jgi:hypothetical protein
MTLKAKTLALAIFSVTSFLCTGQKVKYKDLFVLLQSKQYEQAEPFLKKYLKENQDNPNAFLFMGNIFEEKAMAFDVLKETEKQSASSDSAALFFDRAMKEIDEREVKKNEEYYQAYSRRDLRTGKFGLKLSDIQLDLEKRIKALKERQQRVKSVNAKFAHLQELYASCGLLFKGIAERYKNQKEFYLRSDDVLSGDLRNLGRKYDSCLMAFNDYKLTMQGLGKTGYNQELDPVEIADFKKDGYAKVDFYQDELKLWDFKRWALSNLDIIEKEVVPMNEALVKLDSELNGLREKVRKDSVSVRTELAGLSEKIKKTGVQKFDPNPLPIDVFNLKICELDFASELALDRRFRDSTGLVLRQGLYKKQIKYLSRIDSVVDLLSKRDFDSDALNYRAFVMNSYGSADVLKKQIKSTGDFAISEKAERDRRVIGIEQALHWVIDQADSIPVTSSATSRKYFPLATVADKYTYGLTFKDSSAFAYFYTVTPSRKVALKSRQRVDSTVFKKTRLPLTKSLSFVDAPHQTYYVVMYSERKVADKIAATVYKVAGKDGLVWQKAFKLEGTPIEAVVGRENGELSLKLETGNGAKAFVIQRDGKQL